MLFFSKPNWYLYLILMSSSRQNSSICYFSWEFWSMQCFIVHIRCFSSFSWVRGGKRSRGKEQGKSINRVTEGHRETREPQSKILCVPLLFSVDLCEYILFFWNAVRLFLLTISYCYLFSIKSKANSNIGSCPLIKSSTDGSTIISGIIPRSSGNPLTAVANVPLGQLI